MYRSIVLEGEQLEIAHSIPHLYRLIIACKGKTLSVRRPRYNVNRGNMAICHYLTTTSCVPHLHRTIFSSTSNALVTSRI